MTQALAAVPADRTLALVGHSGAGALLPGIGQSVEQLAGRHFHMLVDPAAVTAALIDLAQR